MNDTRQRILNDNPSFDMYYTCKTITLNLLLTHPLLDDNIETLLLAEDIAISLLDYIWGVAKHGEPALE